MKFIALFALVLTQSCLAKTEINVVHFNIKELDSSKIKNPPRHVLAAAKIINRLPFDIISVQEMQYDLPGVPDSSFKTEGENMENLMNLVYPKGIKLNYSFAQANTGNQAKKKEDGSYYPNFSDPTARNFADPVNFGIFPGQYSSALASKYPIKKKHVFTNIKWSDFNKSMNPSQFSTATGKPLPSNMELFDKNFNDTIVEIDGREVHVIFLHTVPSYHFGNQNSPNYKRNEDQLHFLEWYLTGSTDIEVNLKGISPITGKPFIALGDWNTDLKATNPGSFVLVRLFKKINSWMQNPPRTNEGSGFKPGGFSATLDYIAFSDHFELIEGDVFGGDDQREELGCDLDEKPLEIKNKVIKTYKANGKTCRVAVNKDYALAKEASDHFPLYAKLRFK